MVRQNQALLDLIEPEVSALGYELLGIELNRDGHGSILRVYIDKPDGITIDDCVTVSQQLTGMLDVEDPIKGQYELEVSSPGLDRPIFTIEQFRKYIGETIKLRLYEKINERKRFTGVLISVENDVILINCENEDFEVPVNMVDKARLVPQF
ncbi:MAG: ribosome maturation factor RimP [Proteobacteria bacterium]|nr:ribosome maturation factor RimP [Pseudomonadota bacterium]